MASYVDTFNVSLSKLPNLVLLLVTIQLSVRQLLRILS